MTQHISPEQTLEDQRTMRRLAAVIGGFFIATAVLAIGVGVVMN